MATKFVVQRLYLFPRTNDISILKWKLSLSSLRKRFNRDLLIMKSPTATNFLDSFKFRLTNPKINLYWPQFRSLKSPQR